MFMENRLKGTPRRRSLQAILDRRKHKDRLLTLTISEAGLIFLQQALQLTFLVGPVPALALGSGSG